jgi:hypothetical protein
LALAGDNPIGTAEDDALGRAHLAEAFARRVLDLDVSNGVVVGVLGPWGSGKTSFLNMAREGFSAAGAPILDFNPWMFSGTEQLVESFFVELSAQLRLRPDLSDVGKDLAEYGEAFVGVDWLPIVGPWVVRARGAAGVLGKYLQRRQEGSQGRREKLEGALRDLEHPLVVVLDDIDRLSTPEIRDIFRLVRLTASFPKIVYVVAFDRARVEQALGEDGVPGRDYLEKILQVAVDLPAIPEQVLNRQVFVALDAVIETARNPGELDEAAWTDVFMEVIRPLIRNMRDVRRYQVAIAGTLDELEDRVALVDLLAMEAIRLFLPDVFRELPAAVDALCTPSETMIGGGEKPPGAKAKIEKLIKTSEDREEVVGALIKRLFPFAERHVGGSHYSAEWVRRFLRERRIGHESILRLYLERVAGDELTDLYDAEKAFGLMADREAFEGFLRSLEPDRREDVIAALETYEDEYAPEQVVSGVVALWNLFPYLPERPRGMFGLDARRVILRVAYRLLKSLGDPAAIERAVLEMLPQLATLSARREVIFQVGHHEGAGHELLSQEAADRLEARWRAEVRVAGPQELAEEWDLVRVIYWARQDSEEGEDTISIPEDPPVTLAALKSAKTETRSQSTGSRAVQRTAVFAWDSLIELYGGEEELIARIEELKASEVAIPDELAELVERYLGGWRPRDFGGLDDDED